MVCSLLVLIGVPVPLRKTAIAVPDDLLAAVDRAARQQHQSRNQFVTRVLQCAVRARRDAEITRRLDELFASSELKEKYGCEASELDAAGTSWTDESW
jgi:metal-responsive CopG/Arc/MetJ family transcriptional regulator